MSPPCRRSRLLVFPREYQQFRCSMRSAFVSVLPRKVENIKISKVFIVFFAASKNRRCVSGCVAGHFCCKTQYENSISVENVGFMLRFPLLFAAWKSRSGTDMLPMWLLSIMLVKPTENNQFCQNLWFSIGLQRF